MESEPMKVLVVNDEPDLAGLAARALTRNGCEVEAAESDREAARRLEHETPFHVVVVDLDMRGLDGADFLRSVRERDLDVPVVAVGGDAAAETDLTLLDYGAFRHLHKPVDVELLRHAVLSAGSMRRLADLKRRAFELEGDGYPIGDRAGLDARFDRALGRLWLAFQPIVRSADQSVFGYEALVRSDEPSLGTPDLLFDAAERLGRLHDMGRAVRQVLAEQAPRAPAEAMVFLNLHPAELADENLYAAAAPLSAHAGRIVLELTERASSSHPSSLGRAAARLRRLGFRIAIDDLGAGYAGLANLGQLEPDVAILDMSLVRGIEACEGKAELVREMLAVCERELGTYVVCKGVEKESERTALTELGAELLQGYRFAEPERHFRPISSTTGL